MFDVIPEEFWTLNHAKDWQVVEYKSSEPSWGFELALINGKFGNGPTSQEEADRMALQEKEMKMKKLWERIGKRFPDNIHLLEDGWYKIRGEEFIKTDLPKYTAFDYRRASAEGVSL